MLRRCLLLLLLGLFLFGTIVFAQKKITVASKTFGESHILAEIMAQFLEAKGYLIERKLGLGGTLITYAALKTGEVDIYPEYTGTIAFNIVQAPTESFANINTKLKVQGIEMLKPFGFNNGYALAMTAALAEQLNVRKISDLNQHPTLKLALSHEFLKREDGWPALQKHYQLPFVPVGIEHSLAYNALASNTISISDVYTTDGEIKRFDLTLLEDDKQYFPSYLALPLVRSDLPVEVKQLLAKLGGRINETTMQDLNSQLSTQSATAHDLAKQFLVNQNLLTSVQSKNLVDSADNAIIRHLLEHIELTLAALCLACLLALPLALLAAQHAKAAKLLLYLSGLIQTIPSLALLALLIPVFGLGFVPALIALFLYSLLPIVRNTLTGLFAVDPNIKDVAEGLGYSARQSLWHIELPLALPMILAGIKTAAILSIGTATLAAFVGAGGLGQLIITGLTLNNHTMILQGAVPAALLALITEWLFQLLEYRLVSSHFQQSKT